MVPHRSWLAPLITSVALAGTLSACGTLTGDCIGVAEPGMIVEVRTSAGAPTAVGATLIARDGAFADTVGPVVTVPAQGMDSPQIEAAANRAGLYQVTVTKPNWTTAKRLVRVKGTRCGDVETEHVQMVIDPLPDAPAVRGVVVGPRSSRFSFCGGRVQLAAHVDAAPGISRELQWQSSDANIARVTETGMVYARLRGRAVITATSVADPDAWGQAEIVMEPWCP